MTAMRAVCHQDAVPSAPVKEIFEALGLGEVRKSTNDHNAHAA
jgi:hypothetical protein